VCKALSVVKGERLFRLKEFCDAPRYQAGHKSHSGSDCNCAFCNTTTRYCIFPLDTTSPRTQNSRNFPFLFWSREPERKRSRVVASGFGLYLEPARIAFGLYFCAERFLRRGAPPESGSGSAGARQNRVRALLGARQNKRGRNVQYLPGWTVQCINPECLARGHWLRAAASGGELCSNCNAPLHNVPPPLGPRLRLRPRSLGSYRPPGRSPGRPR